MPVIPVRGLSYRASLSIQMVEYRMAQWSSALLKGHEYRQSMTCKDNHYDNAQAESLFSRFKTELLDSGVFFEWKDAYFRTFDRADRTVHRRVL